MMISRGHAQAFTLVELMVTLGIVAIMLTVATPFFGQITRSTYLQTQAESVEALIKYARTEAIITRTTHEVRVSPANEWSVWQAGATEAKRTLAFNPDQVMPRVSTLNNARWVFDVHGAVRQQGSVILCHNNDHKTGRMLRVQASGMISIGKPGYEPPAPSSSIPPPPPVPLTSCQP